MCVVSRGYLLCHLLLFECLKYSIIYILKCKKDIFMHFDNDYILIIHERSFRAFYDEPKVIVLSP